MRISEFAASITVSAGVVSILTRFCFLDFLADPGAIGASLSALDSDGNGEAFLLDA